MEDWGERALLSRAVRTALVWRRPNHDRLESEGGTPCASDADDSKFEPLLVHDRNLPHNQHATPQIAAL